MDKIRIYIALLFCQAISFILPVQAQNNTGSDSNWYNTLYSYDCMRNITSLSRNRLLDDGSYDYYPYGGLMANSTNHNQQRYKYNGKELDRMHGLDWYDYGARWMDAAIGRWHVMDPFCEKYYDVSPYAYCAGDPVNAVDIDGRKIVDANGNLMLFIDKNGMIHYTKFANNDTHTLTNSLSLSTTGKTMLNKIIKSDINVHFHISDEVEMSDKTITYGTTIQGNMNINDNYGKTDDGKNIRESTITIYRGSIKEGIKQGSGLKHEGLTEEQAIGTVIAHEAVHATDKYEISKDIQYELKGKINPNRENLPNKIENIIIEEYKKKNAK